MEPFTLILIAYLEVAQCMGIEHPRPLPPEVTYSPVEGLGCSFGKCSGLYWGPPLRKIKIAAGRASLPLLKHELIHDLLQQRDGNPDRKHRDPAFGECIH